MTRIVCNVVLVLMAGFVVVEAWTLVQGFIARRRNDRMADAVLEDGHDAG